MVAGETNLVFLPFGGIFMDQLSHWYGNFPWLSMSLIQVSIHSQHFCFAISEASTSRKMDSEKHHPSEAVSLMSCSLTWLAGKFHENSIETYIFIHSWLIFLPVMLVFVGGVSLESLPSNAIDDLCSTNQCQCQGGQHRRHATSRSSYRVTGSPVAVPILGGSTDLSTLCPPKA